MPGSRSDFLETATTRSADALIIEEARPALAYPQRSETGLALRPSPEIAEICEQLNWRG